MLKTIINAKNKLISETEQSSATQCWEAFLFLQTTFTERSLVML